MGLLDLGDMTRATCECATNATFTKEWRKIRHLRSFAFIENSFIDKLFDPRFLHLWSFVLACCAISYLSAAKRCKRKTRVSCSNRIELNRCFGALIYAEWAISTHLRYILLLFGEVCLNVYKYVFISGKMLMCDMWDFQRAPVGGMRSCCYILPTWTTVNPHMLRNQISNFIPWSTIALPPQTHKRMRCINESPCRRCRIHEKFKLHYDTSNCLQTL